MNKFVGEKRREAVEGIKENFSNSKLELERTGVKVVDGKKTSSWMIMRHITSGTLVMVLAGAFVDAHARLLAGNKEGILTEADSGKMVTAEQCDDDEWLDNHEFVLSDKYKYARKNSKIEAIAA